MQQVNIRLATSVSTPARVKEGWYKYAISCQGVTKEGEGSLTNTTGNRLVMEAMIAALQRMTRPAMILIITDSRYLINGFQQLQLWQKAGFRTLRGAPVKNEDLWERIYELQKGHTVRWQQEKAGR